LQYVSYAALSLLPDLLLSQLRCCLRPASLTAAGQTHLGQRRSNLPPGQRLLPQLQQQLLLPAHPTTAAPAAPPNVRSALPMHLYRNAVCLYRGLQQLLLLRLAAAAVMQHHLHLAQHQPSAARRPACLKCTTLCCASAHAAAGSAAAAAGRLYCRCAVAAAAELLAGCRDLLQLQTHLLLLMLFQQSMQLHTPRYRLGTPAYC
jgi:hypothetical protein